MNKLSILMPPLLGLKGNLEMTLASRVSTHVCLKQTVFFSTSSAISEGEHSTPYSDSDGAYEIFLNFKFIYNYILCFVIIL